MQGLSHVAFAQVWGTAALRGAVALELVPCKVGPLGDGTGQSSNVAAALLVRAMHAPQPPPGDAEATIQVQKSGNFEFRTEVVVILCCIICLDDS